MTDREPIQGDCVDAGEERIRQATRNIRRLLGTPHHVGAPSDADPT